MKIIYNSIIPFEGFLCINLFGVLFVRKPYKVDEVVINHEAIHTRQMRELWYVPFYIIYFFEWLVRLFLPGNAYRNISFEKEAYDFERNPFHLKYRRPFAQWRKKENQWRKL